MDWSSLVDLDVHGQQRRGPQGNANCSIINEAIVSGAAVFGYPAIF
jgi:hypothetical protein